MSVRTSASFPEENFALAKAVADYQHRSFGNYIIHCVMIESNRRKKQLQDAGIVIDTPFSGDGGQVSPVDGKRA